MKRKLVRVGLESVFESIFDDITFRKEQSEETFPDVILFNWYGMFRERHPHSEGTITTEVKNFIPTFSLVSYPKLAGAGAG